MVRWLLVLTLVSTTAMAREWFVSPAGYDDKGNGTLSAPFRTVGHLLDTSVGGARAGDSITLRGGLYRECDVRLRVPLTVRSYPGENAHIQCDMTKPDSVVVQIDPGASGSRLSHLELSGGMYYGIQLQTEWERGDASKRGASKIVLEHLKIHDTGRDGIKITPHCDHVTIRKSEIWNTGAADPPGTPTEKRNAEGIDNVGGSNMLVEDNHIHDIATTGLYFKGGASDVIVQRNRIENTGMAGILVGFDTDEEYFDTNANPKYYEAIRGIVRNNLVRNTAYAGIGLYSTKDAVIANNTIVDSAKRGHAAIFFGTPMQYGGPRNGDRPPSVNPLIRNNLVIQDGGACVAIRWTSLEGDASSLKGRLTKLLAEARAADTGSGLSSLTGNPNTDWNGYSDAKGGCRFIDERPPRSLLGDTSFPQWQKREHADAHSLVAPLRVDQGGHLPAGSAAIKRGTALEAVTDDIDGDRRTAPYDIGADEWRASKPDAL